MKNNEKLLNEWERLNKQLDAIDYDDIEGEQPEFGGDEAIIDMFVEFQENELKEYEDKLEVEIYDIEKELEKRGFEIQENLNEKREWVYELQKL